MEYEMFKKQYKCEYDEEVDYFTITWEDKDRELIYKENDDTEKLVDIDNDVYNHYPNKNNMFWIEDIKKHYKWKKGECIYLNMKQNCDNAFYVMRGWGRAHEREEDTKYYDVAIDEDGFVIKRYFQYYSRGTKNVSYDFIARPSCIYNDYWTNEI
jgi:hypothetical protein